MKYYQMETLRKKAAKAALISDPATLVQKQELFTKLAAYLKTLAAKPKLATAEVTRTPVVSEALRRMNAAGGVYWVDGERAPFSGIDEAIELGLASLEEGADGAFIKGRALQTPEGEPSACQSCLYSAGCWVVSLCHFV